MHVCVHMCVSIVKKTLKQTGRMAEIEQICLESNHLTEGILCWEYSSSFHQFKNYPAFLMEIKSVPFFSNYARHFWVKRIIRIPEIFLVLSGLVILLGILYYITAWIPTSARRILSKWTNRWIEQRNLQDSEHSRFLHCRDRHNTPAHYLLLPAQWTFSKNWSQRRWLENVQKQEKSAKFSNLKTVRAGVIKRDYFIHSKENYFIHN